MTLNKHLVEVCGYTRCKSDPCLYVKRILRAYGTKSLSLIATRVDGLLIATNDTDELKQLKTRLSERFSMSDLGPVSWHCAMKINRDSVTNEITVSQEPYIDNILEKYGYQDISTYETPMAPNTIWSKSMCPTTDVEHEHMRNIAFRPLIGSLMYCLYTRPDIALALVSLARFQHQSWYDSL